MTFNARQIPLAVLFSAFAITGSFAADQARVKAVVDAAIRPVMSKYNIPGVAIGVTAGGSTYTLDYGTASKVTGKPVTHSTIFELGSITKTFTVTLTSLAQKESQLSLTDRTSRFLPSMRGKPFGNVQLMNLATHTAGGFPLQLPDKVKNDDQLMAYFEGWKPTYKQGTYRTYANPSIGMLGLITAKSLNADFASLMEGKMFPALGLTSTYIHVPETRMADYAQGYTRKDQPARMSEAPLSSEAYGVKSTASDMIRFVEANMKTIKLDEKLQQAITDTHTGYFNAGVMTQDLIWEQYPYPASLKSLLEGNSDALAGKTNAVKQLTPPMAPRDDVLINKTGSTNGFGAYVAFVPEKQLGIVILANKNYPNAVRVTVAHRILTSLAQE